MLKKIKTLMFTLALTSSAFSQEKKNENQSTFGIQLDVQKNSFYEKIGFKSGDIIVGVNGERISDKASAIHFIKILAAKNDNYQFIIVRNGSEMTLEVKVGE